MSIGSTFYDSKPLNTTLPASDQLPPARYSLLRPRKSSLHTLLNRTMSVSEETSGDILTDLSTSLPHKPDVNKRNRRFSELKPGLMLTDRDRRNSTPPINFSALLPNHFRSHKHNHKHLTRDETNTSFDTVDNNSPSSHGDTMTMRTEPLSSSKILNSNASGSRTNLSISSETYPEETLSSLFSIDIVPSEPRSAESLMLHLNTPLCVSKVYQEHFFEYFHTNYFGELQHEGPFIASLRYIYTKSDPPACQVARAIIRIPSRNYDISIPADEAHEDIILQVLFKKAHLSSIQNCKPVGDPKANQKLYSFDKLNDDRQNCKIGCIYQRVDQTDEAEIFNNDTLSNEMIDFLGILADRVRLKGFDNYRGDLDIKNDLHGEYSYYTQYNNREIMFNVAPMVPSTNTTNGLCVKRKGLVGNSFVCIVFQDANADFIPDIISGKVTQIYITVKPVKINEQTYYKIGIWHRNDLTSIIDPPGGIYESDKTFRDYFLTLLLNSINVAIESPSLRYCISEQRQRLKQEDIKRLIQNFSSSGQSLNIVSDIENGINNTYIENRSNSRTDSTISSTTDNNNNNLPEPTGRMSPAPVKKRTLSKIFSVFSGRSGSLSTTSNTSNTDLTANTPSASEGSRGSISSSKEQLMKRTTSVKHHPAPSPPVQTRAPVSYKYSNPKSPGVTNEIPTLQNNLLNIAAFEESMRSRANSSPDDRANTTPKRPLSSVSTTSKEISDTSSIGDYSGDEYSEDEKIEHRPTLTEPPLILSSSSSNTNL